MDDAGADELNGAEGDDFFVPSFITTADDNVLEDTINGGDGEDTILLNTEPYINGRELRYNGNFNGENIAPNTSDIEIVSLDQSDDEEDLVQLRQLLVLSESDVVGMTDADNTIRVTGDTNDRVVLEGFTAGENADGFTTYTDGEATVLVDNDITVLDSPDQTIVGTSNNDFLAGYIGDDTISGGAGNDILIGAAGNDSLNGGAGNDTLVYDANDSTIEGGTGTDTLDLSEAGSTFSLSNTASINSIERLDMTNGEAQTINISGSDVLNLNSNNTIVTSKTAQTVFLDGDSNDTVNLSGFTSSNNQNVAEPGYSHYYSYPNGRDNELVYIYVSDDMNVVI